MGETHLRGEETINFETFSGYFASSGLGKGVAAYSKAILTDQPETRISENYSKSELFLEN